MARTNTPAFQRNLILERVRSEFEKGSLQPVGIAELSHEAVMPGCRCSNSTLNQWLP
jgi:hypothetical protein